jgi:NAD(P)-dependent dehydrogenase (short-subunit alcohol dehydrogenase family)
MNGGYLIFGGSGGIGLELCKRMLAKGQRVLAVSRNAERLAVAQSIGAEIFQADVTQSSQAEAAVNEAVQRFGSIIGMAHCVGSILLKPIHLTTDAEWAETIQINLTSAFNVLRPTAKVMMNSGGSIVLVSTVAARVGLVNHEAIAAAKAGVQGLALSAAATYANRNLRVNCVAPGLVATPLAARLTSNETSLKASKAMHPLGRIGEASDVASMIDFLLDPANSWITGQIIGIDGGLGDVRVRSG